MTEPSPDREEAEASPPGDDPLSDVRAAAGAVVDSLRQLVVAAERLVEDPDVFGEMVASGKSVVEAFAAGFVDRPPPSDPVEETPNEP